jgi:flagella basal body P-ring formation protein FlgA
LAFCIEAAGAAVPVERVERKDRLESGPRAVVSLRGESTVRGPEIRLGEVAEIQSPDPALVERLRAIEIGRAPLPGLSRVLDLPYLKTRLRFQHIDPATLVFDVPPAVSVTTVSQRVSGADLLAVVRQHILAARQTDAAELAIHPTAVPADLILPAGALELRPRSRPEVEMRGTLSVGVEAWVDGVQVRAVSVPVRVAVLSEVLVAARPVGRHAVLTAEDVRLERREVLAGQEPARELAAVLNRRAVRSIVPGELLLATLVESPPLVRRGDVVLLAAEGRGLRALTQGEAKEDGKSGQVIRVRNLASGREVYGEVAGDRRVRVPF